MTLDRLSSASNVYQAGRVVFERDCGLWFGVVRQPSEDDQVDWPYLLSVLQDDGLGGERTSGYGQFQYQEGTSFKLPDAEAGQTAFLLSRYHPSPEELPAALTSSGSAYQLVSVGGWVNSPDSASLRRKQVQLVAEGSFICPPRYPAGDVADITPTHASVEGRLSHPIYRYGLALTTAWPRLEVKHA